jgi:hypothetical protein
MIVFERVKENLKNNWCDLATLLKSEVINFNLHYCISLFIIIC